MKKIRLITFHTPRNYGAVLQAFSLMKYLENFSDDVKVIDYSTPHLRSLYPILPKFSGVRSFIKFVISIPYCSQKKNKYKKFDDFISENFALTKRFESTDELYKYEWKDEIFVTGSDQVFNPRRIEDERRAFYLDFVPENLVKISYAASFGSSSIPDERNEEIKRYLSEFDFISVREASGQKIAEKLTGNTPELVLDPVFLHSMDFWEKYAVVPENAKGKYVLYYRLMPNREKDRLAEKIAEEKNMKLIVITDEICGKLKNGTVLKNIGPQEFLGLYKNSGYVVTDSFHGIAFSIIFKKDFFFADINSATNGRGLNLIESAGIKDVVYDNYSIKNEIDYIKVFERLEPMIVSSEKYLETVLKSEEFGDEN